MELRHLRYFIAAAEEEHFGRAADRLQVTRSTVSQIVTDLEPEAGTLLFNRHSNRVRLTAAGQTLLARLVGVMADLIEALIATQRVGDVGPERPDVVSRLLHKCNESDANGNC